MTHTAIITTLTATLLITMVVLEAEDFMVVAEVEEDPMVVAEVEVGPMVVAGVEDVEDLDRIRDPLWVEFEPRVSTKQGSTAGSEMTLPFWVETNFLIIK
jgi:hypothetical protein